MNLLTNVFYLISTALLIPVMLVLLSSLFQVLLLLGQTLRELLARCRHAPSLAEYGEALSRREATLPALSVGGLLPQTLRRLNQAAGDALLVEKLASDAEIVWRDEVERIGALARRGPALGLMGTLIPLGPALVGLAAGNLQMMSENLVIAFATTVIGLLVGTLAGAVVAAKRRWYRADAALLAFAAGRVLQRETAPQTLRFARTMEADRLANRLLDPRHRPLPATTDPSLPTGTCNPRRSPDMFTNPIGQRRSAPLDFDDESAIDPTAGMANLFDVAMVFAVALMVALVSYLQLPALLQQKDYTVITNPGQPDMEILVKEGEEIRHYEATDQTGFGQGELLGQAYRLPDGRVVYVPAENAAKVDSVGEMAEP
jgi:biopolymer transport protein ExbB/TolQ